MPDKEKKPQTSESEEKDRELFPDELDGVAGGVSDGEDKADLLKLRGRSGKHSPPK